MLFVLATTYSCPEGLPSALLVLTSLFGMGRGVIPASNHQDKKHYAFLFRNFFLYLQKNWSVIYRVPNRIRIISTPRLNTLLCVHLVPIYVIISHDSQRFLILETVSLLDAFRGYPIPT